VITGYYADLTNGAPAALTSFAAGSTDGPAGDGTYPSLLNVGIGMQSDGARYASSLKLADMVAYNVALTGAQALSLAQAAVPARLLGGSPRYGYGYGYGY
jgi:hypothetical protein